MEQKTAKRYSQIRGVSGYLKVTPRVCLGVVYKALSAPFDPLTEAKEQALGVGTHARDTTTISTCINTQQIKHDRANHLEALGQCHHRLGKSTADTQGADTCT